MTRHEIIDVVGPEYLSSNVENEEFSYLKEYNRCHKDFNSVKVGRHQVLDLRFVDEASRVAVLVETKPNIGNAFENNKKQLDAYMKYEGELTGFSIIGILASTQVGDNRIRVWKNRVSDENFLGSQTALVPFSEYRNLIRPSRINDKERVIRSTYKLNEKLRGIGIAVPLRSQFVGTCVLALKNNLSYENLTTSQIIVGIKDILGNLLEGDINRAQKLTILNDKVLSNQNVRELNPRDFIGVLKFINQNIIPFINDESSAGQDLLNLFFTTFNKYVGKSDKNQAFTPDHIVSFMCDVIGINRNSRVLDPCCGSGAFLVRAMTDALSDCNTPEERERVKKEHIYGIEAEEQAFGLSTTNMLIHGDGNSNVVMDSCFRLETWIREAHIDRVLMNPPYNALRSMCDPSYVSTWNKNTKEDPSKGFHYLYYIANTVGTGKLAILLPMQCAIGNSGDIKKYKELMMREHRLDAVFSLPPDVFHPGANASACCMIWELGVRHFDSDGVPVSPTFFGYYKDDGFTKRKNLGRVERVDSRTGEGMWSSIKERWLSTYRSRSVITGLSAVKSVTWEDEWLAEAYMETDFSTLTDQDFVEVIRDYAAFLIQNESLD